MMSIEFTQIISFFSAQNLTVLLHHNQPLRWLDRLKNDDIHQKYDVFRNIISKALEHLQKAFRNDFAEFASSE